MSALALLVALCGVLSLLDDHPPQHGGYSVPATVAAGASAPDEQLWTAIGSDTPRGMLSKGPAEDLAQLLARRADTARPAPELQDDALEILESFATARIVAHMRVASLLPSHVRGRPTVVTALQQGP